jgi:hypothetical protein
MSVECESSNIGLVVLKTTGANAMPTKPILLDSLYTVGVIKNAPPAVNFT